MKTLILEGVVTAISSISHNGGERNGITTQLRREKFVQPDGTVEKVPVISGNAVRGILRDKGMYHMLQEIGYGVNEETGEVKGLPLNAFYFLFSGGALTSSGGEGLDIEHFRKMREIIPLIGLFGGAAGNQIMPGKMKVGKLIPICQETRHLIPEVFVPQTPQSVWEYTQTEFYTRRDDAKNDRVRSMMQLKAGGQGSLLGEGETSKEVAAKKATPQQMMYNVETLAAGTQFYWKVTLEDVTAIEFEALLTTIMVFSKSPVIGGRGATGNGEIAMKLGNWIEIDSKARSTGKEVDSALGQKYAMHLKNNASEIQAFLNKMQ